MHLRKALAPETKRISWRSIHAKMMMEQGQVSSASSDNFNWS